MRSKEKLGELVFELLQEMYQASEPPLDFLELVKDVTAGEECPKDWFMQHEITVAEYERIKEEFFKKHNVTKHEQRYFSMDLLNYSPKFKEEVKDVV